MGYKGCKKPWDYQDDLGYVTDIYDITVTWNGSQEFNFYTDSNSEGIEFRHGGIKSPEHALEECKLLIDEMELVSGIWEYAK